jgi:hypothetical protein
MTDSNQDRYPDRDLGRDQGRFPGCTAVLIGGNDFDLRKTFLDLVEESRFALL